MRGGTLLNAKLGVQIVLCYTLLNARYESVSPLSRWLVGRVSNDDRVLELRAHYVQ